jgi:hypothetical protein
LDDAWRRLRGETRPDRRVLRVQYKNTARVIALLECKYLY